MGIGLKGADWFQVVHKTRSDDADRVAKGERSRLTTPVLPPELRSEIITSQRAEEWIAAHCTRHNDNGNTLPTTERGKRRIARREALKK
jgi:hypothetical protein